MIMKADYLDDLKETFLQTAPVGTICPWSYSLIPLGWLLCDGQELASVQYQELFQFLKLALRLDAAAETFQVPHLPSPYQGIYYIIRAENLPPPAV